MNQQFNPTHKTEPFGGGRGDKRISHQRNRISITAKLVCEENKGGGVHGMKPEKRM